MAINTQWVILGYAAAACLAWLGLFIHVPRCLRSMYRYRLWQIRDDTFDAIRAGDLPDCGGVRQFLAVTEAAIAGSKRWTLAQWMVWPKPSEAEVDQFRSVYKEAGDRMGATERALFTSLNRRFQAALTAHLLWGSTSGWIGVVVALLAVPFKLLLWGLAKIGGSAMSPIDVNPLALRDDTDASFASARLSRTRLGHC